VIKGGNVFVGESGKEKTLTDSRRRHATYGKGFPWITEKRREMSPQAILGDRASKSSFTGKKRRRITQAHSRREKIFRGGRKDLSLRGVEKRSVRARGKRKKVITSPLRKGEQLMVIRRGGGNVIDLARRHAPGKFLPTGGEKKGPSLIC